MTKAVLISRDDRVADIKGIGDRTAERLTAVGIDSVGELADADVDDLTAAVVDEFPRLGLEAVRRKVAGWISLAEEAASAAAGRAKRSHVFLLTLWVDADGAPQRSRFSYRSTDEPTSDDGSVETAGWSPLAFARFVEQAAGLAQARGLSEERVERTEVVEWSRHRIEGPLVRRGSTAGMAAEIPTDELDAEDGEIRWKASGRMVPLGGGPQIALGSSGGVVAHGEPIAFDLGSSPICDRVHRMWFDLAISPAADDDRIPTMAGARADEAS